INILLLIFFKTKPKHILQLSEEERRSFCDSFDHVFSDIDGVLWALENLVPHAADGYKALERIGKQLTFVTNNSVRTMDQCVRRFAKIGLQVKPEQIWHPAQSIVEYLQRIKFEGLIYIIASQPFKAVLREAGFQLLDGESYESLARHIFGREPVRAVVVDVDFNLSSPKILRAHMYLRRPECLLLVGATDRLLPVSKEVNIIGPGPFASILEEASGKPPLTLGKPGRQLGELLVQHYAISQPSRALMIGDMLAQDVGFGRVCGFQTLLVLSGGCTLEQLQAETDPNHIPDYYADSVADLALMLGEGPK
ncbi:hypothetical protein KR059_009895, partial [Drosophila kikkawai]